ncbi:MAG: DUF86 domain-containing protein, partial [Patescibacteria group bacterium]
KRSNFKRTSAYFMKKTPKVYLYDIIDSIGLIEEYVDGKSKDDLLTERRLQDVIVRRLQIIGEAVNRISEMFKEIPTEHPEIPWRKIKGLRNVVIHDYAKIDFALVWDVIKKDLPELKINTQKIMENY